MFNIKERLLAPDAPAVASGHPVGTHYPMTRHEDSYRIGSHGIAYGAGTLRATDPARNLRVSGHLSARYPAQCLPYAKLKRCAAQIERNVAKRFPA